MKYFFPVIFFRIIYLITPFNTLNLDRNLVHFPFFVALPNTCVQDVVGGRWWEGE